MTDNRPGALAGRRPSGRSVVRAALLAVGMLLALLALAGATGAVDSYVVTSDSMAPTVESGDVVVVTSGPVERGDVVTYRAPTPGRAAPSGHVTHRVVAIEERPGGTVLRTKGDANADPDPYVVPETDVVGSVEFAVPYLGHLLAAARTRLGAVLLVAVPGVALILSECHALYRAATDGGERPGDG